MADVKVVLETLTRLKGERTGHEDIYQDLTNYLVPFGGDFWNTRNKGDGRQDDIFDSTGPNALNTAAAGIFARAVNPASKWFSLRVNDREAMEDEDVKEWLEDTRNTLQEFINRNLAAELFQAIKMLLAYGTAVLFIEEDPIRGFTGQGFSLANTWIEVDDTGHVNGVYREFQMTAANAVLKWGAGKVSNDLRTAANAQEPKLHTFVHYVSARRDRDKDKIDAQNMPWSSKWIEMATKHQIEDSGFPEGPYMVPRLDVLPGEMYGRGQGHVALPDILTLNALVKLELDAANMSIRPPLDIPDEAYVTPFDLTPGALNYNQDLSGRRAQALAVTGDIRITAQTKQNLQASIRQSFFNDELRLAQGPQRTATEFLERQQENNLLMSPLQVRIEQGLLEPTINRGFGILSRQGRFLEPPESLQILLEEGDGDLVIVYDSPLAKAQKLQDVVAIDRTLQHIGELTGSGFPAHLNYELDAMSRKRSEDIGLPLAFIKSEDEVAAEKAEQERQAQAQQQLQASQQVADVAATAAQIPTGEEEAA